MSGIVITTRRIGRATGHRVALGLVLNEDWSAMLSGYPMDFDFALVKVRRDSYPCGCGSWRGGVALNVEHLTPTPPRPAPEPPVADPVPKGPEDAP